MIEIHESESPKEIKEIELLAKEIWNEHYVSIVGQSQVDYMLQRFQTISAMLSQLEQGYQYFSIKNKDGLLGYFSFIPLSNELFVSKMYLKKEYRGMGIGLKCFEYIKNRAMDLKVTTLSLTVNKFNTNSIKAYLKMGFKQTDEIVTDIGAGYVMDDFVMKMTMNQ